MANHAFVHLNKKPNLEKITTAFNFINENRFQNLLEVQISDGYIEINPQQYLKTLNDEGFTFGIQINSNNPYLELRHVSGGRMWELSENLFHALGQQLNAKYASDEGIEEKFACISHLRHPILKDKLEDLLDAGAFIGSKFIGKMLPKPKAYKEIDKFYFDLDKFLPYSFKEQDKEFPKLSNKNILNETDPYFINPYYYTLTAYYDEHCLKALQALDALGLNINDFDKPYLKPVRQNTENITQAWIDNTTEPLLFHAIKSEVGIQSLKYITNQLDLNVKSNFNQKFFETFISLPYYSNEHKIELINHCLSKDYDFKSLVENLSTKKGNKKFIDVLIPTIEKLILEENVATNHSSINKKMKV